MRTITDHKTNELNRRIEITAGELGAGGASVLYRIEGFKNDEPAERWPEGFRRAFCSTLIKFQDGPIYGADDYNGLTNEAILAVLIDRLRGFQGEAVQVINPPHSAAMSAAMKPEDRDKPFEVRSHGRFRCRDNAVALTHLEEALMWLQKRTREREARGVEGQQKP